MCLEPASTRDGPIASPKLQAAAWREIVASSPLPLFVLDDEGRVLFANTAAVAQMPAGRAGNGCRTMGVPVDGKLSRLVFEGCAAIGPLARIWRLPLPGRPSYGAIVCGQGPGRPAGQTELAAQPGRRDEELLRQTGMLAHDLREPLRKILYHGARLARANGVALDADARPLLGQMLDAARRMHGLVADLLGYVAVGSEPAAFARVALDRVIAAALDDLSLTIEETGGSITVETLPTVTGNPEELRRVACNLIGNALKFTAAGSAPVVRVMALSAGGEAGFAVEDDGIGFAHEDAPRLFGIFERLNARTAYPGNGMGLAICRRIVDAHGGRLVTSGRPGQGARFEVWLPVPDSDGGA